MANVITKDNFNEKVLKSDRPVLIDFWATWCGPCKMIAPVIEEIYNEHPEYVVGKVDVDAEGELARQFGIMSIPTLVVIKNGVETNRIIGFKSKPDILAAIEK